ncbi:MAG: type II secretion system F family protein [Patescibacteria group bacterium]
MNNIFLKISVQEKILFVKNLAVMTKAGMPILDSLRLLQKQTKSKSMKKILEQISGDIANGQFLSTSMERYADIFGDFTVNIIRVGEASGILYENLNYLAEELKKKQELKKKVIGALIYPIIVVIATFSITGFLTIYIFPKILPIFKSLNVNLPITTKILIGVSDFLIVYGVHVMIGIVIAVILGWLILKISTIRFLTHRLITYLPLLGNISQSYNMANFCRTLGLLLKSDIKVVEALSITANTLTNQVYKKELKAISLEIAGGEEISKHLEKKSHLFPPMLSQLIAIGETTGNLSDTLLYLSEFYENKVDEVTKNLSTILEPLLMIVMGTIVGFIALSIITPIYEVTQGLKR